MTFLTIWNRVYRVAGLNMGRRLAVLLLVWGFTQHSMHSQAPPAPAAAYRLQPGDSFTVMYRLTPEFNQTVSVQPNGDVTLQLIGTINLNGLTLADATESIRGIASKKLNHPEVSLELKDYLKPHFIVLGEVGTPGRYELRGSPTVEDALALAGGLKISARHNNIILIRPINSEMGKTQLIDFKALEKQKANVETTPLPLLEAGDILIVPLSKLSKIERYVKIVNTGVYYNPVAP